MQKSYDFVTLLVDFVTLLILKTSQNFGKMSEKWLKKRVFGHFLLIFSFFVTFVTFVTLFFQFTGKVIKNTISGSNWK